MPDFTIRFTGDRNRLRQAIQANIADFKRLEDAAERASRSMAKMGVPGRSAGGPTMLNGHAGGASRGSSNAARDQQLQMIGLDKLRAAAIKYGDRLLKAEEQAAMAARRRTTDGLVGLNNLRASAIKYGETLRKEEEKTGKAARREIESRMVGLNQLRMSAIKLSDKQLADEEKAARKKERLYKRLLTDEEIANRVHNQRILNENNRRLGDAMKSAGVSWKAAGLNGYDGVKMLEDSIFRTVGSFSMISAGIGLLHNLGQAAREAGEAAKMMADETIRRRDAEREIQSMMGGQPTTKAAVDAAHFNTMTGLKEDESRRFRAAFAGSGAQFEGRTMSKEEYAKFQVQAGKLAATTGIDAEVVGDLGGKTTGFRDFNKFKDKGAQAATGELYQNLAILQRGSGGNATLASQAARITARLLNEDETKGIFKNSREAAIAESVVAEAAPDEADTAVRSAVRGLRGFDKKKPQSKLLRKAGITEATPFLESIKLLSKAVESERARSKPGTKTQDVLAKYFKDERTKNALNVFLNKGIGGGIIADREAFADRMEGGAAVKDPMERELKRAAAGEAVVKKAFVDPDSALTHRIAQNQEDEAKVKRGAENTIARTLQSKALARLHDPNQKGGPRIDTGDTAFNDSLYDSILGPVAGMMGAGNSRENRIYNEAHDILRENAKKAGIDPMRVTQEFSGADNELNYQKSVRSVDAMFRKKGFDPLTGNPLPVDQKGRAGAAPPVPPPGGAGAIGPQAMMPPPGGAGAEVPIMPMMGPRTAIASMLVGATAEGPGGSEVIPLMKEQNQLLRQIATGGSNRGPAPNAAPGPLPNPRMPRPGGAGR